MDLFKVKLETTNANNDTALDEKNNKYIDVQDGYIYVTKRDLDYIMENYKWETIEVVGIIFQRPIELEGDK